LSPRTGRPKSDNPKMKQLGVRCDQELLDKLDTLTEYYQEDTAKVIRRGIEKLYSDIKSK